MPKLFVLNFEQLVCTGYNTHSSLGLKLQVNFNEEKNEIDYVSKILFLINWLSNDNRLKIEETLSLQTISVLQ